MSEWKPGDVAMVTWDINADGPFPVVRGADRWHFLEDPSYVDTHGMHGGMLSDEWLETLDGVVLRPLVVIDPESHDDLERLLDLVAMHGVTRKTLREFARPTPPKPEEPTGLGAVVEADWQDASGRGWGPGRWALAEDGSWLCLTDGQSGGATSWGFLNNVRILSPGVEADDA